MYMAQEGPNRLTEWLLLIREQAPVVRRRLEDWLSAVREEPALIWETIAVRYAAYAAGGLLLVWLAAWIPSLLIPPAPANARPAATTADFHVVCADTDCAHHFVIHRRFGFRKFPVTCPECKRKTGAQARRCNSKVCSGKWIVPQKSDRETRCALCGNPLPE